MADKRFDDDVVIEVENHTPLISAHENRKTPGSLAGKVLAPVPRGGALRLRKSTGHQEHFKKTDPPINES